MSDTLNFLEGDASPSVTPSHSGDDSLNSASAPLALASAHESGQPAEPPARVREQAPISALLDERDKRKAAQAQAEALARQVESLRARSQSPPDLAPVQAVEAALYNQHLKASRRFAEREYGKESVAKVHAWAARRCDEDPMFNHQMRSSEDPYEAAYQAFNRERIVSRVTPDRLAAFEAWEAAQGRAAPGHIAQYHPAAYPPPVPRSLAGAPGNGNAGAAPTPVGPGQAFASVIPR